MLKNYLLAVVCLGVCLYSCNSDEDSLTPQNIETNPDTVSVNQNSSLEIFVFGNDANIPNLGTLSVSTPTLGLLAVNDSNTPDDPSDDIITYTAKPNQVGQDTFNYTVCNDANTCSTAQVTVNVLSLSSVNYDLANFPFQTLSEYNFFQGEMKNLDPSYGVIPYTLSSTLFTDYAKKKRFVWLPNNSKMTYVDDASLLSFPVGAILIKNFYYENVLPSLETRIIETRVMIKMPEPEGWIFAEYVWNNEQTEASLDLNGSFVNIQWDDNGEINDINYRVPNEAECVTCHKINEVPFPIGTKPRNLNLTYNFDDGAANQLDKLTEYGYIDNVPASVSRVPDYNDTSLPLEERVRGYLDINCAHCHAEGGHCDYRPVRFDYESTAQYVNLGVCVEPDETVVPGINHIVEPGDARNSMMHFRINTTDEALRMPLLGRTVTHTEGAALIESWIDSLSIECE